MSAKPLTFDFDVKKEQVYSTHVDNLVFDPKQFNLRWEMPTDEELIRLSESIKEQGQDNPVLCTYLSKDLYVIQGFCRTKAIQLLNRQERVEGIPETPIKFRVISKSNTRQIFLSNIAENEVRFQLTPMDKAIGMIKLYNDFKMTQQEIGARFNVSQGTVSHYLRFMELPKDVQDGLHKGIINVTDAFKLLKVEDPELRQQAYDKAKLDSLPNEDSDKGKSDRVSNPRLPKGAIENAAHEVTNGKVKFKKNVSDLIDFINKEESKEDPELPEGAFRIVNMLIRWFQEGLPNDKIKDVLIKYADK